MMVHARLKSDSQKMQSKCEKSQLQQQNRLKKSEKFQNLHV
ncbi:unnamed protein product [Amoebophrya sp. A25]|nr:unnamed protein product [Amoebophrya sp. A25]|eukprot:GSA25T00006567001.1